MLWFYEITPSVQGEGKYVGEKVIIVRTMLCNLACSESNGGFNCDTYYTWDKSRLAPGFKGTGYDLANAVHSLAMATNTKYVMLTGGEPQVWANNAEFRYFLKMVKDSGIKIHIETNGTLDPTVIGQYIDFFSISPKQSQYPERYTPELMSKYKQFNHQYKFVVSSRKDIRRTELFLERNLIGKDELIYLMPEGITPEAIEDHTKLIYFNLNYLLEDYGNIKISDRLHIRKGYK